MALDPVDLTRLLEIGDPDISMYRDQIVQKYFDPVEIKKVLDRQCKAMGKQKCQSCKSEGECSVVHGVATLAWGDTKNSIKHLEFASRYFSRKDETWNHIISMILLGLAFQQNGNMRQAIRQSQDALLRLERDYLRIHAKDYPEKAIKIKKDLQEFISNPTPTNPAATPPGKRTFRQAQISFTSLPIFSGVKAGPDGPIWEDLPEGPKTTVDQIILDDRLHALHSVSINNRISISSDKKYGLAKVDGDSMTASKPVTIYDKDHVLFFASSDADNGDIVVASIPDQTGSGYQYTVKRLSKVDGLLISETDPPNKYDPIPLDKDTRILGIVIAVATPINE